MIHLILGTDTEKKKSVISKIAGNKKLVHLTGGEETFSILYTEFLFDSLFLEQEENVFVVHGISECGDVETFLKQNGEQLMGSKKVVVFEDQGLLKSKLKPFESLNVKVETFDKVASKELSAFSLCDAIATGSKKVAWKSLQDLLETGVDPNEFVGPLIWWCKGVILEKNGIKNPKPFVQKKFEKALPLFNTSIEKNMLELLEAVDSARGGTKLAFELESWVLRTCPK